MKGGLIQTNTLSGDGRNPARCQQQPTIPDTDRREPKTPLTKADLIAADFKGSWPMFGTNLRMKVGGYLKADLLHFFSMWGIVTCDGAGQNRIRGDPLQTKDPSGSGWAVLGTQRTLRVHQVRGVGTDLYP